MKLIASFLLILALLFLPSCKYFKGKRLFGHKADTMLIWEARQKSIRVADSIKKVQDRLKAIEAAKLDSIRLAEEALKALASKYNIVVGSFITPDYAKSWAEEYKRRGYDAKIIPMEGSQFQLVVAESHGKLREAVQSLDKFQENIQIDAWIYQKK